MPDSDLRVRARSRLPGTRALLGGFLVASAATLAYSGANQQAPDHRRPFVVAARRLAPGSVVAQADLGTRLLELPTAVADRAFTRPSEVVGKLAAGPFEPGELLQEGAVLSLPGGRRQLASVTLPGDDAVASRLRPGDTIDVYSTDGDGGARRVLRGSQVVAVDTSSQDAIGSEGGTHLLLALTSAEQALRLAAAGHDKGLMVARTTGAPTPPGDRSTVDAAGPDGAGR